MQVQEGSTISTGDVVERAKTRWLIGPELMLLLDPETTTIPISTQPPCTPPPSGTLLLYDRNVTKTYKQDGHNYVKKRNMNKVREDHVKLLINQQCMVAGCYVHSSDCNTFHRRAYRLLDPKTGGTKSPVHREKGKTEQSLVLIHYRDTRVESRNSAKQLHANAGITRKHSPKSKRKASQVLSHRSNCSVASSTNHKLTMLQNQKKQKENKKHGIISNNRKTIANCQVEEGGLTVQNEMEAAIPNYSLDDNSYGDSTQIMPDIPSSILQRNKYQQDVFSRGQNSRTCLYQYVSPVHSLNSYSSALSRATLSTLAKNILAQYYMSNYNAVQTPVLTSNQYNCQKILSQCSQVSTVTTDQVSYNNEYSGCEGESKDTSSNMKFYDDAFLQMLWNSIEDDDLKDTMPSLEGVFGTIPTSL